MKYEISATTAYALQVRFTDDDRPVAGDPQPTAKFQGPSYITGDKIPSIGTQCPHSLDASDQWVLVEYSRPDERAPWPSPTPQVLCVCKGCYHDTDASDLAS